MALSPWLCHHYAVWLCHHDAVWLSHIGVIILWYGIDVIIMWHDTDVIIIQYDTDVIIMCHGIHYSMILLSSCVVWYYSHLYVGVLFSARILYVCMFP